MTAPRAPRPAASPLRRSVEQRSAAVLAEIGRRPRCVLPLVAALLLGGVLFLPTVPAALCLLALLSLLVWLSYLSWPVTDARGRGLRLASVALLLVLGVQSVV